MKLRELTLSALLLALPLLALWLAVGSANAMGGTDLDAVTLSSAATLELGKTVSAATAQPGDTLTYTIVVTATGGTSDATLIDQLPAGLSYVAYSVSSGGTYEGESRQIRYTGSVTPGTPLVMTYQATVDSQMQPGTVLYNAVELSSGEGEQKTHLDAAVAVAIPDDELGNQTLVLLYVNGDNDLSEHMLDLANRAEQAAGNEHLTVLLLLDGPGEGDTYLYRLEEDFDGSCPNYSDPDCDGRYVLGQNLWEWRENMASPYSLSEFLIGAQRAYPQANQIILSLVGHGSGWAATIPDPQPGGGHGLQPGGLLWDDHFESSLSTAELGQALSWFQQATGRKIDLLYLDACLMGMSEVAYEVRESVDYLLASESWSWTSFSYDAHLNAINASTSVREIGEAWLANEAHVLRADDYPFTYSLIDLSQMTALREAQDLLATELIARLPADKSKIEQAFEDSVCFDSNSDGVIAQTGSGTLDNYCDLHSFAGQIKTLFSEQSAVLNAAQGVQDAITSAVAAEEHNSGIAWQFSEQYWEWGDHLGGLSSYLPLKQDEWRRAHYNGTHLQSAQDGQWDEFLSSYWNATPPAPPECLSEEEEECDPAGPLPIAKISLHVSAGHDSINIGWTPQQRLSSNFKEYQLYRSDDNGSSYSLLTSLKGSQHTDDSSLSQGTDYCYQVKALNGFDRLIGESNIVCVKFGQLTLWIPDEVAAPGATNVHVPINLANGNGLCTPAMNITIHYDETIAEATGTVLPTIYTENYAFSASTNNPGEIKIVADTGPGQCQELHGGGSLFVVGFDISENEGEVSPLEFITGLTNTVIYEDENLITPIPSELEDGSLTVRHSFIRGDLNGDAVVNAADSALALRVASGWMRATNQQHIACDANGDQVCNSADAVLIRCYAAHENWAICGGSESRDQLIERDLMQDESVEIEIIRPTAGNAPPGSTVSLPIQMKNTEHFAGGDFTFLYDAKRMTVTEVALTELTSDFQIESNEQEAGILHISLAGTKSLDADGEILTLEFAIGEQSRGANRLLSHNLPSINLVSLHLNDATGRDFETSALQQEIEIVQPELLGDVNCDDKVDILDGLFIAQYASQGREATDQCPLGDNTLLVKQCDVNHDGQCNILDALSVVQCAAEMPNDFCLAP